LATLVFQPGRTSVSSSSAMCGVVAAYLCEVSPLTERERGEEYGDVE
jgi:hypothetical protein